MALAKYETLVKDKARRIDDCNSTCWLGVHHFRPQAWSRGHGFSILRHFLKYADKHEKMTMVREVCFLLERCLNLTLTRP